jgi:hypothetical protein
MTRNGKIARLPREVRNQLNRRLQDGEPGTKLVGWLNSSPEVQSVVAAEFASRPVNEQNLSEWKQGGYRDWLLHQDALEQVPPVATEASELNGAVPGQLSDHMAVWLTAHLMAVVRRLAAAETDDAAKWRLLHEAAADIAAFRRGDHGAERLKLDRELIELDRERLDLDRERVVIEKGRSIDGIVDMLMRPARKDPKLLDAVVMICNAIKVNTPAEVLSYVSPSERKSARPSKDWKAAQPPAIKPDQTKSNQIKPNETVDAPERLRRRHNGEVVPPPISMEVSH